MEHRTSHLDDASAARIATAFQAAADAAAPTGETAANLIATSHALAGVSQTATIGLLSELIADIRAGTPRPDSKVAHHANRLRDATPPDTLPVFMRAKRVAA
jgi:hypothetical protein